MRYVPKQAPASVQAVRVHKETVIREGHWLCITEDGKLLTYSDMAFKALYEPQKVGRQRQRQEQEPKRKHRAPNKQPYIRLLHPTGHALRILRALYERGGTAATHEVNVVNDIFNTHRALLSVLCRRGYVTTQDKHDNSKLLSRRDVVWTITNLGTKVVEEMLGNEQSNTNASVNDNHTSAI